MALRTGAGALKQIKANALFYDASTYCCESAQPPPLFARNMPHG